LEIIFKFLKFLFFPVPRPNNGTETKGGVRGALLLKNVTTPTTALSTVVIANAVRNFENVTTSTQTAMTTAVAVAVGSAEKEEKGIESCKLVVKYAFSILYFIFFSIFHFISSQILFRLFLSYKRHRIL
jgi:hypothetical protein